MRAHREGTVYQRSDGRWMATLYDDRGRRRWLYGRTRQEVLDKRKTALRDGLPAHRPVTVAAWLARWRQGLQLRPSTVKDYASKCRRIEAELGKIRLDRLSPERIEKTYAAWLAEGLSPGMVRNLHRVLHAALNEAVKRGHLSRNPAAIVRAPTPRRPDPATLTVEQAKRVLAKAAALPDGARWWLALLLGMRQGEVLGLQWSDVDLDNRVLVVRQDRSKTGKGRALPLPDALVSMLDALPRASVFVFPRESGQRRDSKQDWTAWQMLLASCGLPRMRVHDARHTTPSLLLELGVPARVVSEILGHSTVRLTMDVYTHVGDPATRAAVEKLTTELTAKLTTGPVNHAEPGRTKKGLRIVR